MDDLLKNPFNTQPSCSLDQLHTITGFDRHWLMFLYRNFKQVSPLPSTSPALLQRTNGRSRLPRHLPTLVPTRRRVALCRPHLLGDRRLPREASPDLRGSWLPSSDVEDLILCLHDLASPETSVDSSVPGFTAASFAFALMGPDDEGRVSEKAFVEYALSVFSLSACRQSEADAAAFGLSSSCNGLLLEGRRRRKGSAEKPRVVLPASILRSAAQQFQVQLTQGGAVTGTRLRRRRLRGFRRRGETLRPERSAASDTPRHGQPASSFCIKRRGERPL